MSTISPQLDSAAGPLGLDAYDEDRVAAIAAKAYARIAGFWKLKADDAAAIVGVSTRTWARMRKPDWSGRLSQDQLLRISAVAGLYKALHLYFSDELADRWVGLENTGPLFLGRAPVRVMVDGGLPAIMEIRDYVDALRGGV